MGHRGSRRDERALLAKAIRKTAIEHVEGPLPSSTPLERDARLASTDHKVAASEIAIGVIIGRAAEYFDFFVFAIASVVVFPKVFFPFAQPLTATLYSFAVFALAFVARPIGSLIFTAVDRRHGRGVKLTIALFLLGFSTMAMSFLPSYDRSAPGPCTSSACCGSAGTGTRRRVGRARLAPRAERADRATRLLCRNRPARGARRLHRGEHLVLLFPAQPV